jgi:hypothetical protein
VIKGCNYHLFFAAPFCEPVHFSGRPQRGRKPTGEIGERQSPGDPDGRSGAGVAACQHGNRHCSRGAFQGTYSHERA